MSRQIRKRYTIGELQELTGASREFIEKLTRLLQPIDDNGRRTYGETAISVTKLLWEFNSD